MGRSRQGIFGLKILLFIFAMTPQIAVGNETFVSINQLLKSAHDQVGVTLRYDPAYRKIAFPGGDVAPEIGVCTDVIVRAYRGVGLDLQLLVNQDMRRAFGNYPRRWGLRGTDTNIDHRRVPNLAVFFARKGQVLPITNDARDYKPGDIVTWILPSGRDHIGIVSDQEKDGRRLVVHNIGFGTRADDILFAFKINGHFRYALPKS